MKKLLKIYTNDDSILREKCLEVDLIDERIRDFAEDMWATMEYRGGCGLAANQVGENKRIIIVNSKDFCEVMVNPKIIKKSKEIIDFTERCLSLPNISRNTGIRSEKITVTYKTLNSEEKKVYLEGFPSVIVQHEVDHLDGKLLIDYPEKEMKNDQKEFS